MNKLWKLDVGIFDYLALANMGEDEEPPISVTFNVPPDDMMDFVNFPSKVPVHGSSPVAELVLTRKDFEADYFRWAGPIFVSEKMRQAMALDPAEALFFELDDSRSAPLPRAKAYQIMEPQISEDVSDRDRSNYEMTRFMPDMPFTPRLHGRMAVRSDAAPKHDLFYDAFFSDQLLCTDAFALRVLKAGCTGMWFEDLDSPTDRTFVRTLRGIEERIRPDPESWTEITELIQAIDLDGAAP
jgi:hypothetical protein